METRPTASADTAPASWLARDFLASIVVFLVALPLCLGIAQASALASDEGDQQRAAQVGILTGCIGGIIVGTLAGCPLQVSGPPAGLVVLVLAAKSDLGLTGFGWALLIAGVFQFSCGLLRFGAAFRAISPAVVHGMLSGIGLLIAASQLHVLLDHKPDPSGNGLRNILGLPEAFLTAIIPSHEVSHDDAAILGLITIGIILFWDRLRPARLKMIPAPLVALTVATLVATLLNFPVRRIQLAGSLSEAFHWLEWSQVQDLPWRLIVGHGLAIGLVASAESLLSAAAVDTLARSKPSDNNRELLAQGVGNTLCGIAGLLPITGVVVRSVANIQSGATTRASAIFHGFWLLAMVLLAPGLLAWIPTGALASVLVYTGFRLIDFAFMKRMWTLDRGELAIFLVTMGLTVGEDLLIGVASGIGLALVRLLWKLTKLRVSQKENGTIAFLGNATFLRLPVLHKQMSELMKSDQEVRLDLKGVMHMDHAFGEALMQWKQRLESRGRKVNLDLPEGGFTHLTEETFGSH